ncbi:MAG: hypothetical protein LBD50_01680 [Rickettsiales bacterium]|jgi:hypothetical protein|nr:hypothetical protein [Rickettsiales bacterium]
MRHDNEDCQKFKELFDNIEKSLFDMHYDIYPLHNGHFIPYGISRMCSNFSAAMRCYVKYIKESPMSLEQQKEFEPHILEMYAALDQFGKVVADKGKIILDYKNKQDKSK